MINQEYLDNINYFLIIIFKILIIYIKQINHLKIIITIYNYIIYKKILT